MVSFGRMSWRASDLCFFSSSHFYDRMLELFVKGTMGEVQVTLKFEELFTKPPQRYIHEVGLYDSAKSRITERYGIYPAMLYEEVTVWLVLPLAEVRHHAAMIGE